MRRGVVLAVLASTVAQADEVADGIARAVFMFGIPLCAASSQANSTQANSSSSSNPSSSSDSGPSGTGACGDDYDCTAGYVCREKQCITRDEAKKTDAVSQRRRAFEVYLSARRVEVREELALARGPLIAGIARTLGIAEQEATRAVRAHRGELTAVMGDGTDPHWPRRALARMEVLCPPT